jgi:hypothetical protein
MRHLPPTQSFALCFLIVFVFVFVFTDRNAQRIAATGQKLDWGANSSELVGAGSTPFFADQRISRKVR